MRASLYMKQPYLKCVVSTQVVVGLFSVIFWLLTLPFHSLYGWLSLGWLLDLKKCSGKCVVQ